MVFKVTIRLFPKDRRASFISKEVIFQNITAPTVKHLIEQEGLEQSKIALGVSFVSNETLLTKGEAYNIFPQ